MFFSLISQFVVGFIFFTPLAGQHSPRTVLVQLPAEPIPTVGIKECDEFVKKYMSCILSKIPASERNSLTDAMRKTVESWKTLTTNEANKTGLAEACKMAMENVKQVVSGFGCEF